MWRDIVPRTLLWDIYNPIIAGSFCQWTNLNYGQIYSSYLFNTIFLDNLGQNKVIYFVLFQKNSSPKSVLEHKIGDHYSQVLVLSLIVTVFWKLSDGRILTTKAVITILYCFSRSKSCSLLEMLTRNLFSELFF